MSLGEYYAYFSMAAFIYVTLLFVVYIAKEKEKKTENSIFIILSLVTIISIFIELIGDFGIPRLNMPDVVVKIIEKIYLISNVLWTYLVCCYAFLISNTERELSYYKKYCLFLGSIAAVFSVIISYLDVSHYINEEIKLMAYLTGPAVNFSFVCAFVFLGLAAFFTLKFIKRKNFFKDKETSGKVGVIVLTLIWSVYLVINQILNPEQTVISFSETIIVTIIYFFLENPDLELLDEMKKAKISAEIANTAKTDFLSSMSHEIRTPLNVIVGLSEHIKSNNNISDKVREDIDDITVALNNLLEVIGNIIDIDKIESDTLEIVDVKYVFEDEFESLIRVVSTRIGDKPIKLNVNIDKNIPFELIGDKFHIKSIINNLLTNSIKYTESGHIDVDIKATDIIDKESCILEISVTDTGSGIKNEDLPKLFTKFERLNYEGNAKIEGSGVGLSITKKIVEIMGGRIDVESTFGEGSKFTVRIPQKISKMECELTNTQRIDISAINERIEKSTYNGYKVLLVDDNKLNLKVARKAIEPFNFIIDECKNGEECLNKIISGEKYDLILMDIMMPVMDGETAMRELKKIVGFNTPVIAVTADAIAGAKEKYLADGFSDYIAKPFTKEQIKIRIDSLFTNKDKFDKNINLSNNI